MKTEFKIGQRVSVKCIKKEGYYHDNGIHCDSAIYNGVNEYGTIHIHTDDKTIQYGYHHVTSGWYSPGAYEINPMPIKLEEPFCHDCDWHGSCQAHS